MSVAVEARDPHYPQGVALVLLSALALSPGGLLIRFVEQASDWQLLFYRSLGLTISVSLFLTFRYRGGVVRAFARAGWTGFVGGVVFGTGFIFYVLTIRHTTVANALFVIASAPFFAALLGWVMLRERVPPATWAAILAAALGVGIMVYEGLGAGRLFGNLMGLGAAITYAILTVTLRMGKSVDMVPWLCTAGVTAALISGLLAADLAVTRHDLLLCLFMGGVQVTLGFMLITYGARHVPAAQVALLALLEMVLAPAWVALVLDEIPTLPTLLGGVLVLSAVAGQALRGTRK